MEVLLLGSRMLPELAATAPPHLQGPAALVHRPFELQAPEEQPRPLCPAPAAPSSTVYSIQWHPVASSFTAPFLGGFVL